jgi:hypothetical protein
MRSIESSDSESRTGWGGAATFALMERKRELMSGWKYTDGARSGRCGRSAIADFFITIANDGRPVVWSRTTFFSRRFRVIASPGLELRVSAVRFHPRP